MGSINALRPNILKEKRGGVVGRSDTHCMSVVPSVFKPWGRLVLHLALASSTTPAQSLGYLHNSDSCPTLMVLSPEH